MAISSPSTHFALRTSEPNRAACGSPRARQVYVGEVGQDELGRRLRGQVVTTCVPCRRAMRWDTSAPSQAAASPGLPIGRWTVSRVGGL